MNYVLTETTKVCENLKNFKKNELHFLEKFVPTITYYLPIFCNFAVFNTLSS